MVSSELSFRIDGRRIWVAGHRGMVGSALMRRLAREDCELVTVDLAGSTCAARPRCRPGCTR